MNEAYGRLVTSKTAILCIDLKKTSQNLSRMHATPQIICLSVDLSVRRSSAKTSQKATTALVAFSDGTAITSRQTKESRHQTKYP